MDEIRRQGQAYETPRLERVGTIVELTGGFSYTGISDSYWTCFGDHASAS
jgi:hypothetical protein